MKKVRPPHGGADIANTPSTQNKPLGGLFSPLAQYPGAGYAEVFATARNENFSAERKPVQAVPKTVVRTKETMAQVPEHFFTSALLLVDDEGNARMDKNALREAGIGKIQVLTSGLLGARFLSMYAKEIDAKHIDIIICHPHLGDMSALQWIELIRLHPLLKRLPVLGIAGSNDTAKLLRAFGGGFTDIVVRPYSQDDLRRILYSMQEAVLGAQSQWQRQGAHAPWEQVKKDDTAFAKAMKRLESFQSEGGRAESFVQDGLHWLKAQEWDKAITILSKALYNQDMRGEAEYGLAVAWQGKKNVEKHCYYLSEACLSLVRSQKWAKARMAYTQLLKVMPAAINPFVAVAENLVRAQKYRDAAGLLVLGLPLGNAKDAAQRLARACYYNDNPQETVEHLQKAFTAPVLQGIVQDLPAALVQVTEEHEKRLQQRREERAALREKARAMPVAMAFTAENTPSGRKNTSKKGIGSLALEEVSLLEDDGLLLEDEEWTSSKKKTGEYAHGAASAGAESLSKKKKEDSKGISKGEKNKKGEAVALQPLFEEDVAVEMFSPKLNDIATVIKTTWKIMKGK